MNLLLMLPSTIRLTLPMLFGSLGIVLCAQTGVIFMAMEGALLESGFVATYVCYLSGNALLGELAAVGFGMMYSAILSFFINRCSGNHVVCSIGFNFISLGATTVLMQPVFGNTGFSPNVTKLPLVQLPVIGEQSVNLFLMLAAIVGVWLLLFRTNWGLRARAIGENPGAADSLGIRVTKYRLEAMLICGILAGIGGAELTLGQMGFFARNMTANMGFLSYSAVVFAGYSPLMVVITTLVLGFFDAFQMNAQLLVNIPSEFLLTLPYVVTILSLALFGSHRAPAMFGKNYSRGEA